MYYTHKYHDPILLTNPGFSTAIEHGDLGILWFQEKALLLASQAHILTTLSSFGSSKVDHLLIHLLSALFLSAAGPCI